MIDSNNEISQSIAYNLEKNDDGYEITIIPDKEWLHDSSRVYPVIIDPTITGVEIDKSVIIWLICMILRLKVILHQLGHI